MAILGFMTKLPCFTVRTRQRADSGDVNILFRRDVNKSERSDAGICHDA